MSDDKTTIINSNTDIYKQLADATHCIELFFQGKEYRYERKDLPISIGRNAEDCILFCDSSTVSRKHCILEVKDNQIGISDCSTNGTYIKIGRAETVLIKSSFYPLASQGNFSLGEPINMSSDKIFHFRVCPEERKTAKK